MRALLFGLALFAIALPAQADDAAPASAAPYVSTPAAIVDAMLTLAGVGRDDYVVDLGSGDGRLVIEAVKRYGARGGFGVDIDPALVDLANRNASEAGMADRVRFYRRDLFATDVREATVVTVYLLPSAMARLERKLLAELKPGTRVVTHDYPFPNWRATRDMGLESLDKIRINGQSYTQLWLYTVGDRASSAKH